MRKKVVAISIDAIAPDGKSFVIRLEIGTPYHCATGEWACPVALRGLRDRLRDARGVDSFQALCMAVCLTQDLLQDFLEKGGRLLMDTKDFPLEAYSFGMARSPHQ